MSTGLLHNDNLADVTTTPGNSLGIRVTVAASGGDSPLYYVNATTGVVTIKNSWAKPSGTDEAVEYKANSGPMEWVYVFNDTISAIPRGALVAHKNAESYYKVRVAPASCAVAQIVGVAQHEIPAGRYGWVLSKGVGQVLKTTANNTVGANIIPSGTAGQAVDGTLAQANIGYWIEASTAGTSILRLARIHTVG